MVLNKRIMVLNEILKKQVQDSTKVNIQKLSKDIGCSRTTIYKYYDAIANGIEVEREKKQKLIFDEIEKNKDLIQLKASAEVKSLRHIYNFVLEKNYNLEDFENPPFSYSYFKKYCKENIEYSSKRDLSKSVVRYETLPAEQSQVDWKESINIKMKHGQVYKINVFALMLSYSRKLFLSISLDRTQESLIRLITEALAENGGTTKEMLFDNMKTVITGNSQKSINNKINKQFKAFAKDMGFEVKTCKICCPQTKGKIEKSMRLIDEIMVYDNECESIAQLQEKIKLIQERHNSTLCEANNLIPNHVFLKKEKHLLTNLPNKELLDLYINQIEYRLVNNQGIISFRNNFYSVPVSFVNKKVEVIAKDNLITIKFENNFICQHELIDANLKKCYSVKENHMIDSYVMNHKSFSIDQAREQVRKNIAAYSEFAQLQKENS